MLVIYDLFCDLACSTLRSDLMPERLYSVVKFHGDCPAIAIPSALSKGLLTIAIYDY